jgi:hypothetical protein
MPPSRFIKETKGIFSDEDFFEDEEIIMEDSEDGEWEMM